jgi:hypothetical protein
MIIIESLIIVFCLLIILNLIQVGYKATRFYWSVNRCFKRCRYLCSINENEGHPEFSVTIIEEGFERETFVDNSPSSLWQKILAKLDAQRKEKDLVKIFPIYFTGEYLFGLMEPHITRLIESLPGVETLTNYAFKYGKLQLLDMPLTINPTGCARSEPKLRTHFRKSSKLTCNTVNNTGTNNNSSTSTNINSASNSSYSVATSSIMYNDGDDDELEEHEDDYLNLRSLSEENVSVSYNKQFVLSKSTQFKKLKAEWRSNVYLAKSQIQVKIQTIR